MPSISELAELIQDTNAALAAAERAIAETGPSWSFQVTVRSLEKRQRALEQAFLEETERQGVDVCSYRVFTDAERPKALAVARALESFQALVSSMYGAIKDRRPRKTSRLSAEAAAESMFDFGYAFPGSVGFVLTIPNERLLFGGSDLDQSIERILEISQAENPADIAKYAETLGPAPIRAMYKWTEAHLAGSLGVDIQWRRALDVRTEVRLQVPQLAQLRTAIEATSIEEDSEVTLSAMLRMFNADNRSFALAFEGGDTIRGVLADDFQLKEPLRVPLRYTAWLTKKTKRHLSTDQEEVRWILNRLEPV